jgi:hypothetical protein
MLPGFRFILGVVPLLAWGCVAAPIMRTYLEPNPQDGTPPHPGGCSWPRTGKDGLLRKGDGLELEVFPTYAKGKSLEFYVRVGNSEQPVGLQAKMIELHIPDFGVTFSPIEVVVRDGRPYWHSTIVYRFQTLPAEATAISLVFLPTFLVVDSHEVRLGPFRFTKARKLDMYYQSINC